MRRAATITVLLSGSFSTYASAGQYSPPRGIDVARRHGGNWTQRAHGLSSGEVGQGPQLQSGNPHTQGGPLLGNADLSAVLQVDKTGSVFSFFVTKTDAWSANDIFGLGVVSLSIPALNGSSQSFIRQELGSATTFTRASTTLPDESTADGTIVNMSSFIAATKNIMITSISIKSTTTTELLVSNGVYSGITYDLDPKTRMPTGAPPRTLDNCTDFTHNNVRNRGPHRAGFAGEDASTMWGLYIDCTNGTSEASRLALSTRILTPAAAPKADIGLPTCGPMDGHGTAMSACATVVTVPAGNTALTVLSSSLSNI
eukprot:SAG31_NODE_6121_length_2159_cov_7.060673_2_plen_313_part_01